MSSPPGLKKKRKQNVPGMRLIAFLTLCAQPAQCRSIFSTMGSTPPFPAPIGIFSPRLGCCVCFGWVLRRASRRLV
jgi:hypothetical protein